MTFRPRLWGPWAIVALVALVVVCLPLALYASRGKIRPASPVKPAPPAATPPLPKSQAPAPPAAWLGLNYNSASQPGSLTDFAERGIVYDREGKLEVRAGTTAGPGSRLLTGLATAYAARMVPDIVVNPGTGRGGCRHDPVPTKLCLPTTGGEVSAYVGGFVQTALSVLRAYPHRPVLFEPMDEPWNWAFPPGTESGRLAAREYADTLVRLLSAARAAQIPVSDILVPATGQLEDGSWWIPDLYDAQPCLKPGRGSCVPVAGWNLHPYGLPHQSTEGIDSVPRIRAGMLSGQDNIVISEIGFCAIDVGHGAGCAENQQDIDGTSSQVAKWLRQTLQTAATMHRAGWLRALLVWYRSGGGFGMQHANGTLTAQGRVLDLFADSLLRR